MLDYYQTNLFKDISMDEYKRLLSCLEAREKRFSAGETICSYDSGFGDLGIIGTGTACVVRYEFNGARTILERICSLAFSFIWSRSSWAFVFLTR